MKTDNRSLASKVALRRWLLGRMGFDEVRVLDTCAGLGLVWDAMEPHVTIRQWTRCDVKPRRHGTLAVSALEAIEKFQLDVYNVVDIDPYGEPWEPYRALLARLTQPTAVFLTRGFIHNLGGSQKQNLEAIGIPAAWPIPHVPSLSAFLAEQSLSATWHHATITYSARVNFLNVTYYALGLLPQYERRKES